MKARRLSLLPHGAMKRSYSQFDLRTRTRSRLEPMIFDISIYGGLAGGVFKLCLTVPSFDDAQQVL